MQRILVRSEDPSLSVGQIGEMLDVRITGSSGATLIGEAIGTISTSEFVQKHGSTLPSSLEHGMRNDHNPIMPISMTAGC